MPTLASKINYLNEMVGETRFELATLWSQTRCATRLRHSPTWSYILVRSPKPRPWQTFPTKNSAGLPAEALAKAGGPGGTRTPDLAVMSGQL